MGNRPVFCHCYIAGKGANSHYDNCHEAPPRVRLVVSMRKPGDRTRLLLIEFCRYRQKRRPAGTRPGPSKESKEGLLHRAHRVCYSAALRSAGADSDHRSSVADVRQQWRQINSSGEKDFTGCRALPGAAPLAIFYFLFQAINARSCAPTFSIGCFSPSRRSRINRRRPVALS